MKNKILLSTTCLALCMSMALSSTPAAAQQEMGSLVYYDVPASEYTEHYNEWRVFLEYNLHREQCQHYAAPPEGFVMKGCHVYRVGTAAPAAAVATETAVTEATTTTAAPAFYTVHFGFNKSNVPVK